LLVVDVAANLVELLSASLRLVGLEVATATVGSDAVTVARRKRTDLLVLDVMMPGMDGFDLVRKLRGEGLRMPVLFLTARDATADRVTGLTLGGDDYVTKPFSLEEVIARIRAILRRAGSGTATTSAQLIFADIELDDDIHEVRKGGQLIELSPTEFKLLRYFMRNPGRVLSKTQILEHVWNYNFSGDTGVIESYVSYLRRKLDTTEPRLLQTVRGVGYVLRVPRA
ncbi:MAG: response regulator transcription factor, partial [Pseudonocardiaceae bacterium]